MVIWVPPVVWGVGRKREIQPGMWILDGYWMVTDNGDTQLQWLMGINHVIVNIRRGDHEEWAASI